MRVYKMKPLKGLLLALFLLAFMAGTAGAVEYNITAGSTTINMPDGASVPAWGFAIDVDQPTGTPAGDGVVKVPGDPLVVLPGDEQLIINLTNNLPEATSLHILGQMLSNNTGPVIPDGRVRSFSHEAGPTNGTARYEWNAFKPGTYMLQSGTNPAKQVQMGLYAAVIQDYPLMTYDEQFTMVLHEVDPIIHNAIDVGQYGPGGAIPSSAYREPRYFLINGQAYPDIPKFIFSASIGDRVLLRFVNAGLVTHVPTILGMYMTAVAEDGIPYTYAKEQYGFEMAAAKTMDVIIEPTAEGSFPIFDGTLMLSNMGTYQGTPAGGGMLAYLQVAAVAGAPVAVPDDYNTDEDTTLTATAGGTPPGVLGNDTPDPASLEAFLVSYAGPGTLALSADGSFTYTPNPNFFGADAFTYKANDGAGGPDSNVATVTITVDPLIDDPPVITSSPITTATAGVLYTYDVEATDPDLGAGDVLTFSLDDPPTPSGAMTIDSATGLIEWTPVDPTDLGDHNITVRVTDTATPTALFDTQSFTITVSAAGNQPPVAVDDYPTVVRNSVGNLINVVQNDYDPDGTIDTTTVVIEDPPANGAVVNVSPAGVVTYTPNAKFKGTDSFSYRVQDNELALSWRETATGPADAPTRVFVNVVIKR